MTKPLSAAGKAVRKLFADAPKRLVQIGGVLNVYIGEHDGTCEKDIKRALQAGKTVIENNVTRWVECWPIFDSAKSGSKRYTWKDGSTVRVERILFTKTHDGKVARKVLGRAWRKATEVL